MKQQTKKALRYGSRSLGRVVGSVLKIVGTLLLTALTTGVMLSVLGAVYVSQNLNSNLEISLDSFKLNQTSKIYYMDKKTNQPVEWETLHAKENRELAEISEIPKNMIEALVAIEDKRFFSHQGVDWKRTLGAFSNLFSGNKSTYGGSTITQQLIKNLTDDKDVTVKRKLTEIFRALEFEKHYTKNQILEWYLNTSYFGQGCYGVKVAARTYFGKELKDLTPAESACIIGITNSPTRYDPFQNPDKNKVRQEAILLEMYKQEFLDESEYKQAVAQKLVFNPSKNETENGSQSYFVDQVYRDVADDFSKKYGVTNAVAQQMLLNGGYKIYTTVDMDVQAVMDEIFTNVENVPAVRGLEKPQAAMILMDPYTGAVLGMEGGVGEKKGNLVLNRATGSRRQPGSSIKPIAAYGPALELAHLTPYSVLDDSPFSKKKNGKAWPRNSNGRYKGLTTVLQGITSSTNTIAVRALDVVKPETSYEFLTENFGVTSLVPEDVDYAPLALGGLTKGISVLEITAAYCTFPNHGVYTKPRTYSLVTDAKGEIVIDNQPKTHVAMQEKNAWYMNTMLQSVVKSGTGSRAKLKSGMPAAGKTGTTTDDFDRWFVGYTPYYCAGVWFGFDDPKKIALEQSTNPALALWKQVMDKLHDGLEEKSFFSIENTVKASYCMDSGMKPGMYCSMDARGSRVASGVFFADDVPTETCTVHTMVTRDKESGELATPYCPAENLQQVALLKIDRELPVQVSIEDGGYRMRGDFDGTTSNGPSEDGRVMANAYCHLHPNAASVLPSPDPLLPVEPFAPVDPLLPVDPPESYEPTDNSMPPDLSSTPPWQEPNAQQDPNVTW